MCTQTANIMTLTCRRFNRWTEYHKCTNYQFRCLLCCLSIPSVVMTRHDVIPLIDRSESLTRQGGALSIFFLRPYNNILRNRILVMIMRISGSIRNEPTVSAHSEGIRDRSICQPHPIVSLARSLLLPLRNTPGMSLRVPEYCSSSTSLDLRGLCLRIQPQTVLSESITFETLPTVCSEDVPPFPAGHSPPLATVIGLWSRLSLFPLTIHRSHKFEDRPYVTTPTAPRLKTMLDERICVKRWAVRLHFCEFGAGN